MGTPRFQITLGRMMFAVAAVALIFWLAMIAQYHLSGRAYDDWVDSESTSTSKDSSTEPALIQLRPGSAR